MTSSKKIARLIKAIAEYMANVSYKSASVWYSYQPKEPPKPENIKKSS